jgi:hypothetical protein
VERYPRWSEHANLHPSYNLVVLHETVEFGFHANSRLTRQSSATLAGASIVISPATPQKSRKVLIPREVNIDLAYSGAFAPHGQEQTGCRGLGCHKLIGVAAFVLLEIRSVIVCLDHVASVLVKANHSVM